VIRGIEEHLLKDSRHHITVRTSTATALYVLNHKRSSLLELEERFGLSIAIEADDEVGAQHYAITRGAPAEPRGPVQPSAVEDTPAFEAMEADDENDTTPEERSEFHSSGHPDEEGDGQRKRRRRRRRRGGRDHGDERDRNDEHKPAFEAEEAGMSGEPDEAEGAGEEIRAAETAGQDGGYGDSRKRRRGRRGGKRNRRDRGEYDQTGEAQEAAAGDDVAPLVEIAATAASDVVSGPGVTEIEVVSAEEAAPAEAEKPKKPARRRSRKAEAAAAEQPPAANGEDSVAAEVGPNAGSDVTEAAEPGEEKSAEQPVVVSSGSDEAKPRKTGWWQRKSFF
jgi:ribonuclease E